MEFSGRLFILCLLSLVSFSLQVSSDSLIEGRAKSLTENARIFIDGSKQAVRSLERKLTDRKTILADTTSNSIFSSINFVACANLTQSLSEGETLLVAGFTLFYDADNNFNEIVGCFNSKSNTECWENVVADLPRFLAKYKDLSACYINNVYYTIEIIDYEFADCLGHPVFNPPAAPPKTFEQCSKNS